MKFPVSFLVIFILFCTSLQAQIHYTPAQVHAHNDYQQPIPFLNAYSRRVGSMEADVYLKDKVLYVAHEPQEIASDRTLEALYLKPLQTQIRKNKGTAYSDKKAVLQLLIDLKTTGATTLPALVKLLGAYPEIFKNSTIKIVISGEKPAPATWAEFPAFIHFDGTPGQQYNAAQSQRVGLISDSFRKYTAWNGKGKIVAADLLKIQRLIDSVHHLHQKIRFWATPDNVNSWKTLMQLGVDYIGTDDVTNLTTFLKKLPQNEFQLKTSAYPVYPPKYVNNDQLTKVKNVILLIGDGMGLAQIYAGYTGQAGKLNLFNFLNIGLSKTSAADTYITDSAAGATAMATGKKTNNRYVGVDSQGKPLTAIPDLLTAYQMKTALISAGDITDATPACFYAHQNERSLSEAIALDFTSSPVDILIGGNSKPFIKRADSRNLFTLLQQKGYRTATQLTGFEPGVATKFVVLDSTAMLSKATGRNDFLRNALRTSIKALQPNKSGFFIMAEGAQIDHGGHQNNLPLVVQEMLDFDQLVGEAMQFADENGETLVVVTADHETGGLSLLDGNLTQNYVAGNFSSDDHSAIPVPVFAYGPHSLDFRGVYENTALFDKIMQIIKKYH
ncbi:alkaline phosphatase [Adhaeribacter pallidiroseus]|uniref:Glycerophosphodiester phosphodiesterase n=1 Tax=Adhaeribacter pallidiroseus TaxID=2072847 RepID=A0A369QE06_9BACT|nr:alkaline phosphatase [Adhaeribacter pallidiroseus]RDC62954.1 Glycerophosphodiester phosphodiesterase [Adhaeribacter pallidiroseus]